MKKLTPFILGFAILGLSQNANAGWFKRLMSKKFYAPPLSESKVSIGKARKSSLDPNHIKVMVWNVYKASKKKWTNDFKKYGNGTDLFLLQEAALNHKMLQGLDYFPNHRFDLGISFIKKSRKKSEATGTMIGANVNPTWNAIYRTHDREPIINTFKVTTAAKYPVRGRNTELLVINIHGINMTDDDAFFRHIDQCMSIIADHDGPVIFGGDFNSKNMERANYMFSSSRNHGLSNMMFRNDKRRKSLFSRLFIDFVFTRGLSIKDAEILKDVKTSDHKAMIFEASIN